MKIIITVLFVAALSLGSLKAQQAPPATPPPQGTQLPPPPAMRPPNVAPPVEVHPKEPYDSTKALLVYEKQKNLQYQANTIAEQYQTQLGKLRDQFQDLGKQMTEFQDKTRKDNGWDDTYNFDPEKDKWFKTEKAKAEAKPATPPAKPAEQKPATPPAKK